MDNVLKSFLVAIDFDLNKSRFQAADKAISDFSAKVVSGSKEANASLGKLAEGVRGTLDKTFQFAGLEGKFGSLQAALGKFGQSAAVVSDGVAKGLERLGALAERVGQKLRMEAGGLGFAAARERVSGEPAATPAESVGQKVADEGNSLLAQSASVFGKLAGGAILAGSAFTRSALSILRWSKDILAVQGLIAGGFTAVAGSIIGLADHIANADLEYQLLGMRMMMTLDQARRFKIATDLLGASIEDIAFNPELRSRFEKLQELMRTMQSGLGPAFEANMRSIRDLGFDFKTLGMIIGKWLGPAVISRIFSAFGITIEGFQEKVERFIRYLSENIGPIADKIADKIVPILRDAQGVFLDFWEVAKSAWGDFKSLITGLAEWMNGFDDGARKIDTQASAFSQFFGVIEKGVHWMGMLFHSIVEAERALVHFLKAANDFLHLRIKEGLDELKAGVGEVDALSGGLLGAGAGAAAGTGIGGAVGGVFGGALGSAVGPLGTAIGAGIGTTLGSTLGAWGGSFWGGLAGMVAGHYNPYAPRGGTGEAATVDIQKIEAAARRYGLPPAMLVSLAQSESGLRQREANGRTLQAAGSSAKGVMQLTAGTARALGVDPDDEDQNIEGGARYLRQQLDRFQDPFRAIMAYHDGPGAVEAGHYSPEAIKEAQATLARLNTNAYAQLSAQGVNQNQNSTSNQVNVSVTNHITTASNASPDEIAGAVDSRMRDSFRKEAMLNMMRLQPQN